MKEVCSTCGYDKFEAAHQDYRLPDYHEFVMVSKKSAMGKKSRAQGKAFELKVRHDLEDKGWIVCKWANNVDLKSPEGKLISAKHTFNPYTKAMSVGSGFPDFIAFKKIIPWDCTCPSYDVIAVESKMTGILDLKEKIKVDWLLDNHIFEVILIASKGEKRGDILYETILKGGKKKENEKVN